MEGNGCEGQATERSQPSRDSNCACSVYAIEKCAREWGDHQPRKTRCSYNEAHELWRACKERCRRRQAKSEHAIRDIRQRDGREERPRAKLDAHRLSCDPLRLDRMGDYKDLAEQRREFVLAHEVYSSTPPIL